MKPLTDYSDHLTIVKENNMKKFLLALPVLAGAAGFQILEQNVTYLGQAYAGTAASVENASAAFYNPAGITENKGWQVSLSTCALFPVTKYTLTEATPYYLDPSRQSPWVTDGANLADLNNEYEAKHNIIPIPQLFVTKDYGDKIAFGFSINSPYGLKSEYPSDTPVRFWAQKSSLSTVNFSFTGAYKLTKELSLGLGPDYSLGYLYLSKISRTTGSLIEQPLHGNAWAWHAGIFYKSAQFDAGFRYSSTFDYNLSGKATANGVFAGDISSNVKAPEVYVFSLNYHFNDKNNFLIDVQNTNWNRIEELNIAYGPGAIRNGLAAVHTLNNNVSATNSIVPMNYKQAWRGAFGYQYLFTQDSKLRLGIAFDGTPANDTDRIPAVPDASRTWYSIGYSQKWGESTLDLGYSFVKMKDAAINLNDPASGELKGNWKSHVHIFGIQWNAEWK